MIPDVSFLIPTYRNYVNFSQKTVESIINSKFPFSFEIIICSKSVIADDRIKWVAEPENNSGSVLPLNLSYYVAKGKYVGVLNDDLLIDGSFSNAINFLESDEYQDEGKAKITCLSDGEIRPNDCSVIPGYTCDFHPYGLLRWPILERENIKKFLGKNLFDSRFKHHQADVYLTNYLFRKHGQTLKICEKARAYPNNNESNGSNDHTDSDTYNLLANLPIEQLTYE